MPLKVSSYQTGLLAEALCRWSLRLRGYRILANRYRGPVGEIDIVARRGSVLTMVEVKARPTLEEAMEAVDLRQQRRLTQAAADFLRRHPALAALDLRFDVMLVCPRRWPRHLRDAWRPEAGWL